MKQISYKRLLKHNLRPARPIEPPLKIRINVKDFGTMITNNAYGNPDNYDFDYLSKAPKGRIGEIIRAKGSSCCNPYSRKGCKETITIVVKIDGLFYQTAINSDGLRRGGLFTIWEQ